MKEDGKHHEMKVQFLWYGTTSRRDKSGAYLFLPDGQGQVSVATELVGMHAYWNSAYCWTVAPTSNPSTQDAEVGRAP